jgi:hypothetical protein
MEGERTPLPGKVLPGSSVQLIVKGIVPQSAHNLVLKVTLVQEGVAWFFEVGAPMLEIPVQLK